MAGGILEESDLLLLICFDSYMNIQIVYLRHDWGQYLKNTIFIWFMSIVVALRNDQWILEE